MAVVEQIQRYQTFDPNSALAGQVSLQDASSSVGTRPRARRAAVAAFLLVCTDLAAFAVSVMLGCAMAAALGLLPRAANLGAYAVTISLFGLIVAGFAGCGHFDRLVPAGREWRDVCWASTLALLAGAACAFLLELPLPRAPLLFAAALLPVTLFGFRRAARRVLDRFSIMTEPDGLPVARGQMARLGGDGIIISYRNNLRRPLARGFKVAFDVAAAGVALAVLAPVFALIALAVRSDGGPALFAHKRIGAKGQVFGCLKFRSMAVDSGTALQAHLAADPEAAEEWALTHKLRHDPRITWVGRFLRKTSMDELPQLINVLRQEMSLVGPRPIVSLEIGRYAEDIAYYYEARPGITGLWQVSGRNDTSYAHRVRLDSWYVKNWTVWLDLVILARTLPAVVSGRGAN